MLAKPTICKQGCGLSVVWMKAGTRWKCLNQDGTDHWDLCSQTRTAIALRDGKPFVEPNASGVIHQKRKKYMAMHAPAVKKEIPTCAACVPPWETCPNNCPIEFRQ